MISVYDTPDKASYALAEYFVETATIAVKDRGQFSVVLTGGSSPKEVYRLLAQAPFCTKVPWDKTFVFWGDERCVPTDDSQNNARMTSLALLDHVPIQPRHIYRMNGTVDASIAASEYESQLKTFFNGKTPSFDLVLLGMGENAHTASLFPHTSVLKEQKAWVKGLFIEEVGMSRITLTAPLINQAKKIAFLLFGTSKAHTLNEVLQGDYDIENKPVQLINPTNGTVRWFLDKAAASELKSP